MAAGILACGLFWYVLTRFRSGEINAIDFTVYFDRPCFQTVMGRALFVEVSDTPGFSYRSEFADHAYWAMLPICSVYAISPSPLWLHAISALAITAGAFHLLRVMEFLGAGGLLAAGAALAFVLNDNTARALNYGFHPEVLYAWLVPWMLDAGLRGARRSFALAMILCLLVKEDALLPIFAVSMTLGLHRARAMTWAERRLFLIAPPALAFASVIAYYNYVVPMLTGASGPSYAHFWANWGDTPALAAAGMLSDPGRVVTTVLDSGIFRVLMPFLFLPLIGWRFALGTLPIIVLFGASANEQIRDFGIYYPIVLVPFLSIAGSVGGWCVARRLVGSEARAQALAAGAMVLGAILVGSWHRGYSLRPWKAEIAAVSESLAAFPHEKTVLVQSGLFPHAGYDERFKLLTPETLGDPANDGVPLILAPRVGAYPFRKSEVAEIVRRSGSSVSKSGIVTTTVSRITDALIERSRPSTAEPDAVKPPEPQELDLLSGDETRLPQSVVTGTSPPPTSPFATGTLCSQTPPPSPPSSTNSPTSAQPPLGGCRRHHDHGRQLPRPREPEGGRSPSEEIMNPNQSAVRRGYVTAIINNYLRLPGTPLRASRNDRRLAAELHDRGMPPRCLCRVRSRRRPTQRPQSRPANPLSHPNSLVRSRSHRRSAPERPALRSRLSRLSGGETPTLRRRERGLAPVSLRADQANARDPWSEIRVFSWPLTRAVVVGVLHLNSGKDRLYFLAPIVDEFGLVTLAAGNARTTMTPVFVQQPFQNDAAHLMHRGAKSHLHRFQIQTCARPPDQNAGDDAAYLPAVSSWMICVRCFFGATWSPPSSAWAAGRLSLISSLISTIL